MPVPAYQHEKLWYCCDCIRRGTYNKESQKGHAMWQDKCVYCSNPFHTKCSGCKERYTAAKETTTTYGKSGWARKKRYLRMRKDIHLGDWMNMVYIRLIGLP